MNILRDASFQPINNRDLVPEKRNGTSVIFLVMDHPGAWGRLGTITAGHGGTSRHGYRQNRCYSRDNFLYSMHGGLPDKGRQKMN